MPQDEFGAAIAESIGSRFDGLSAQAALQIVGKFGGAVVAIRRCLGDCFHYDRIQIASQMSCQLPFRGAPPGSGPLFQVSAGSLHVRGGNRVLELCDRSAGLEMIWLVP